MLSGSPYSMSSGVADHAPLDGVPVAHDRAHLGLLGAFAAVDGAARHRADAVDVGHVEGERDLGVEALARGGDSQLAQRRRELAGDREAVDAVLDELVGHAVDVRHLVFRRGHRGRLGYEGLVAVQRGPGLGIDRVQDHVVERAAERGDLVGLDGLDDLQAAVLVGPFQLVGHAGGGDELHALALDELERGLVRALLRPLGHDLGLGAVGEQHVLAVREDLRDRRGQRRDHAGVLRLGHHGGHNGGGELDFAGVECH